MSWFTENKNYRSKSLNLIALNNLNLKNVDLVKFPLVKILNNLPDYPSLYETVLISINDYLVLKFLKKKISFNKLIDLINKFSIMNE